MNDLRRREFLKAAAAFAATSAGAGLSCVEIASAAPIEVPTIDRLTMRVLIDQAHDQFLRGSTLKGVVHEPPGQGRSGDARNVFHNHGACPCSWNRSATASSAPSCSTSATPRRP